MRRSPLSRFTGQLAASPLRLGCLILSLIPGVRVPVWLLKWTWHLSRHETDALRYLSGAFPQDGVERAQAVGERVFSEHPLPSIAAFLGILAVRAGQIDGSVLWLERARACETGDRDMEFRLELLLCDYRPEFKAEEIAARVLARRDVSMGLTRTALETQAEHALFCGRWPEAQAILDRVFAVEDPPHARWMRWVAAAGAGQEEQARRFYDAAWRKLAPRDVALLKACGWSMLGQKEQGRSALREALSLGLSPDSVPRLCRDLAVPPDEAPVTGPEEAT